jgi:hypothetical protein
MTKRQVPSACLRRTSADLDAILTGLLSGPVPLNYHSVVTRDRSLA